MSVPSQWFPHVSQNAQFLSSFHYRFGSLIYPLDLFSKHRLIVHRARLIEQNRGP